MFDFLCFLRVSFSLLSYSLRNGVLYQYCTSASRNMPIMDVLLRPLHRSPNPPQIVCPNSFFLLVSLSLLVVGVLTAGRLPQGLPCLSMHCSCRHPDETAQFWSGRPTLKPTITNKTKAAKSKPPLLFATKDTSTCQIARSRDG